MEIKGKIKYASTYQAYEALIIYKYLAPELIANLYLYLTTTHKSHRGGENKIPSDNLT